MQVPTEPGRYDEIGSSEGVVGFGTHFWIKVHVDADGHAAGTSYSRADCRRHYLVKVFDVLHLNGDDLVHASVPLLERKALLETAFRPIPKFVELAESTLVDLHAQPAAILDAFGKARADGLEGLMLKAACRPYGPLIASDGI